MRFLQKNCFLISIIYLGIIIAVTFTKKIYIAEILIRNHNVIFF